MRSHSYSGAISQLLVCATLGVQRWKGWRGSLWRSSGRFGLIAVLCCVGWMVARPIAAEGVPIKLCQAVDGLEEFDTCDLSREAVERLADTLESDYPAEFGNVAKIRQAIRTSDYFPLANQSIPLSGNPLHLSVFAGTGENGYSLDSDHPSLTQLAEPKGVAVFPDGRVLIVDSGNHRVLEVSADGTKIDLFAGTGEKGNGLDSDPKLTQLQGPQSAAVFPDGRALITDSLNIRVLMVSADGSMIEPFAGIGEDSDKGVPPLGVPAPTGVAVLPDDRVLISRILWNDSVVVVSADGSTIEQFVGGNTGRVLYCADPKRTQLKSPFSVAVFPDGRVLIADFANNRVLVVSADGLTIKPFAGTREKIMDFVSDPKLTRLDYPMGVGVFPDGRALIADTHNHRVLIVSADGSTIERFAGTGKKGSNLDSDPKQTELNSPSRVAVFPDGRVLIADTDNNRVLLVTGA